MTYIAYPDEFGHIGPYISKKHPELNDSPVFGQASIVLSVDEVRGVQLRFSNGSTGCLISKSIKQVNTQLYGRKRKSS